MSTIKADTLSNLAGTQTVPVSTVAQGSAKAWVNFNGTGTVAIRASFNVSSITDNGTGDYTVNFTTAMPDANYTVSYSAGGTAGIFTGRLNDDATARTSSAFRLLIASSTFTATDAAQVNASIFR
jgi:hypothetical protein